MKTVALVIPVYNEEKYLPTFLSDLYDVISKLSQIKLVILIDDGSTDKTPSILNEKKDKRSIVLRHPLNRGKGAAMRTGLKEAVRNTDAVIFMDSDRQHNPSYLPVFINALEIYPVVFGYRELNRDVPYIRKFGNNIARFVFRTFFQITRKDLLCGYMGVRKDLYKQLHWHSDDYGVEAEISAITGRKKIPFKEIRIDTIYLDRHKGVNLWDAFFILLKIPFWYFQY